jgi:hypothetical protein
MQMISLNKGRKPGKSSGRVDYKRNVRAPVYGLWNGTLGLFDFVDSMSINIRTGFTRAWYQGAAECGIKPSELTQEEKDKLESEINEEISYVVKMGKDIERNSKAEGGKWAPFQKRVELWANRYDNIYSTAMSYACKDKKLAWVMNPKKEHCSDCLRMDGRVYRASIWKKYNIAPRMRSLACGGFLCGCSFEITNAPATSGRPPAIAGR